MSEVFFRGVKDTADSERSCWVERSGGELPGSVMVITQLNRGELGSVRPFDWGYGCEVLGAHDLAYALLLTATRDEWLSCRLASLFAHRFVKHWRPRWRIRAEQVAQWAHTEEMALPEPVEEQLLEGREVAPYERR